mgnify:CR=1 FL=1
MRNQVVKSAIIAEFMLALVVVVPTLEFQTTHSSGAKRKHPPRIESFTPAIRVIEHCPWAPLGTCSPFGKVIKLEVRASDPENDQLTYKYSVASGAIVGSGAAVDWNLTQSRPGVQTANVEVTDARGGKTSASTTIVICGSWIRLSAA